MLKKLISINGRLDNEDFARVTLREEFYPPLHLPLLPIRVLSLCAILCSPSHVSQLLLAMIISNMLVRKCFMRSVRPAPKPLPIILAKRPRRTSELTWEPNVQLEIDVDNRTLRSQFPTKRGGGVQTTVLIMDRLSLASSHLHGVSVTPLVSLLVLLCTCSAALVDQKRECYITGTPFALTFVVVVCCLLRVARAFV